jgi:DNA-binding CsgD family transcriptional regulator
MGIVEDLEEAREAYERREWLDAYQALSGLDSADLRADDFTALATTAYLLGRHNDCVQALQRAFQANVDAGDPPAAARSALWLALVLTMRGERAVGGGWAARATRILDDLPDDVVERGYAAAHAALSCVVSGDFPAAFEHAAVVVEYGRRYKEPDLLAHGLNMTGRLMTHAGQVQEGLRLMDESLIGVVAGDVSPIVSGIVYCTTVEGCALVHDFGRMVEWTRALSSWCDAQPGLVAFTGQCAVHRGQMMRLRGAFDDAVEELERAAERYALSGGGPAVGLAHEERGDVLRLLGDLRGAERAYEQALRYGNRAQPGQALLCSARGDVGGAVGMIQSVLDEVGDPVERTRLLPAAVQIHLAAGDVAAASSLVSELGEIAAAFGSPGVLATHAYAAGTVALAADDPGQAAAAIRPAIDTWTELDAPYEIARCRVILGEAHRRLGDDRSATAELAAARDLFAEIGAEPAEQDARRRLGEDESPGGLTGREIEVLRLVAAGKTNAEVAAELVIAEKTVARHLSNIFTKLGVGSRTAAAAFAYEHGLVS